MTSAPAERDAGADPMSLAVFTGQFAAARCTGRVNGIETGFSFKTSQFTATDFFAEMGKE